MNKADNTRIQTLLENALRAGLALGVVCPEDMEVWELRQQYIQTDEKAAAAFLCFLELILQRIKLKLETEIAAEQPELAGGNGSGVKGGS